MGEHRGWIIVDRWASGKAARTRPAKRYLARVWDRYRQTHISACCVGRSEAREWIAATQAAIRPPAAPATGRTAVGRCDLAALIDPYLAYLADRGRAEQYIRDTGTILRQAVAAGVRDLSERGALLAAERWVAAATCIHPRRAGRPIRPATRNKMIRMLRAVGNWALERDLVDRHPFRALHARTTDDYLRPTFSLDECRALVRGALQDQADYGLAVTVLAYSGLRTGELARLEWPHVHWEEQRLVVRGKRRKERTVPLQAELSDLLRPLRQERGAVLTDARIGDNGYHRRQFAAYLERCGVAVDAGRGRRTPHSLRHTWVCLMLASGVNAPLVQVYAGHTALTTTAGYARMQAHYTAAVAGWGVGALRFRDQ